jgi:hypothetical protein
MPLVIFNDAIDDVPDKAEADGFTGFDGTTDAAKLAPDIVRDGENLWADVDLLLQTRPGLAFNTLLTRAALGGGSQQPRGMAYYDIPGKEAVLVSGDGKLYEITDDADNATSNVLTPTPSATATAYFAQLVDHMFYSDGTLRWSLYSGGAWSHGSVTTFSSGAAMPTWSVICAHGLRLLAVDPATGKIYASAIGQANAAADWVSTENIRVNAEGDLPRAMLSGQSGNLIVICERSAWMVDTADASAANWTIRRITTLAGTAAGRTAVQVGQDVLFLADPRLGVVSLGALAATDSISAQTTLSAPVQSYLRRINAAALETAWAVMWGDLYLLAVPLDSATVPNYFLPFNTRTRRWAPPWTATLPTLTVSATDLAFAGFVCGATANFGGTAETLLCDNTGRVLRWDDTTEKDASAAATEQEIVSWATTKSFTHEVAGHYKQPMLLELEWFNSTGQEVQVNLVRDGLQAYPDEALVDCEIVASGLATASVQSFPLHFPLEFLPNESYTRTFAIRGFGRYRRAAVQIVAGKKRMRLRAVRLSSFIDAPPLS